jgi:hypothetical protein
METATKVPGNYRASGFFSWEVCNLALDDELQHMPTSLVESTSANEE